jgi:acetylornithine/succinyldiaminopimelate/putrescine aminotransferase
LSIIEDEHLLENARHQGRHAVAALSALQSTWIREVRGVGLMLGIELAADFASRCALPAGKAPSIYMVERLHEAGLLTIPSGTHILRWLPPLNVQTTDVDEAVGILSSVLATLPTP